jgi:glycosyltransferase involved in cell wall biosynthesis
MRICAVVPSYNHVAAIGAVIDRLRAADLPVFVIDDGSAPAAAEALAALHAPGSGVVVHRLGPNQGKGAAVMAGFALAVAAGFSHAVQVDADGQHDLDALPVLLRAARAQPDAFITGRPVFDNSIPRGRRIGRWITHVWVWIETLSFQVRDSMCGFRIYPLEATAAVLRGVRSGQRMDFDPEIVVRLVWAGIPVIAMPVRVIYPPDNPSNFDPWRDNLRISWMHTRQPNKSWPPIEEDGLSNAVAIYLTRELASVGIFANREVEVVRKVGAPIGRRTDILINTNRRTEDGRLFDPLTAVIETKGCWNRELYTAIDPQLVADYMVNLRAPVGIYLVGWFDNAQWDNTDYRRGQVPKATIAEVRKRLDQQAAAAPEGFQVRAMVLDIKPPGT